MTNTACRTEPGRTILHVDMDAYYAAVEQRDNPSLGGRPVIVGGSAGGRGVVSAASYEARRDGVHSAMPMITAQRLCPAAVILPTRMSHYAAISRQIREIFQRFTPLVEPLALDEAFLDVTPSRRLFGSAIDMGREIKEAIAGELQLVASVGVAPNKFVAKIASDLDKPDGFVTVRETEVRQFLDPLPIQRMWGVGRAGAKSFHQLGLKTFGDLRRYPADALRSRFGPLGEHFRLLAEGIDDRPVVVDRVAKSISHETTFEHDISDRELLRGWLMELTEQVGRRVRRHQLACGRVFIKVRWSDFRTVTRSRKLQTTTNATMQLWQTAVSLLDENLPLPCPPVRLLGMGVDQLRAADPRQMSLFDREDQRKQGRLDATLDELKDRLGADAVRRGNVLGRRRQGPKP